MRAACPLASLLAASLLAAACGEEQQAPGFELRPRTDAAAMEAGRAEGPTNGAGGFFGAIADAGPPPRSDRYAFCAHADDDVSAVFCALEPPAITSLAELKRALDLVHGLLLGHSTGLGGRLASPINPRAILLRLGAARKEYAAAAFTRGEQRVEIVSLDRTTGRLNFYLLEFSQACNAEPDGCSPEDRFTPAIESDWLELRVRDDEELKNTKDDCRRCHGGA